MTVISTITVNVSQRKANCFAEKAITDNRRKTIAKPVKTINYYSESPTFAKQSLILSYIDLSNVTTRIDHLQGLSAAR